MAVDGYLNFDTRISTKGFSKGINAMNGMLGKLAGALTAAFSTAALVAFGKEALQVASDMQEVQNVVDTAFGEMAYKMEQFADVSIKMFGISRLAAKQTGSTFAAMGSGMGLALDTATDVAVALTGLSADMASFYNVTQETASTALKSVYTGETETLKQFGIVMTQTNLEAYALSQGITKSYKAMTEAEKVMLRYGFVMKSTALAQGDFAKTSGGWANQTRILSEQWKEFMLIVGNALMQVALPAVKRLNDALSSLISYADGAYHALANFFGWEQMETSAAAGITTEIGAAVDEQNALTEAAKETANVLAGFDKINKLTSSDAESTGAGDGTSVISTPNIVLGLDGAEAEAENTASKIGEILSGITTYIDFAPLLESLSALRDAALPIVQHLGDALGWVWENVLKPLGKWAIEDLLPASIDVLTESLELLDAAIIALKPYGEWLWREFIKPLSEWTGEIIVTGLENLASVLDKIGDWIRENPKAAVRIGAVAAAAAGLFAILKAAPVAAFITTLTRAFRVMGMTGVFTVIMDTLGKIGAAIGAALAKIGAFNVTLGVIIAGIVGWGYTITELSKNWEDITDVFEESGGAFGFISGWLEYVREDVEEFFQFGDFGAWWYNLWSGFGEAIYDFVDNWKIGWEQLSEEWNTYWDMSAITSSEGMEDIKTFFTDGWANIKKAFTDAPKWAKDRMQDIKDGFANAPKWFSEKFQTGWTNIKTAFSADSVKTWFSDRNADIEKAFSGFDGFMSEKFGDGWENVKSVFADTGEHFKGIWEDITQAFADGDIGKWFSEQFRKGYDNVTGIFDELDGYFDGIWDDLSSGAKEGINFLLDKLNAFGDKIEFLLNGVVDGLNAAMSFSIPDYVPGIGGTSFGLNMAHVDIPPIPKLATGTVVPANYGEFLAILGDNKREAEIVSPISAMEQAMQNVLAKHSGGDIHLNVNLDGKSVYKTVIRRNNESIRMTGKNPLNPA